MRPAVRAFLVIGAVFLAAACSPRVELPGPSVTEPYLTLAAAVMADGTRLPLHRWAPTGRAPDAILVAVHGFNDYGNFIRGAASWLSARGVSVYAYDQRGFGATSIAGLWPGTEALVDDLRTVVRLVRVHYPGKPLFILGDSMGGAVVMVALASSDPPPVDGAVLAAPAVWGRETMRSYQRCALEGLGHTVPWLLVSGADLGIMPSDNRVMLHNQWLDPLVIKDTRVDAIYGLVGLMDRALASAPALDARLLILYGERDEIIPKGPTRRMLAELPDAAADRRRVALYPEGYHMLLRDLEAETYWADILHWMSNPAEPLPSGADRHYREAWGGEARD